MEWRERTNRKRKNNILMSLRGKNEQMSYVIVCGSGETEHGDWLAEDVNQSVKGRGHS